MRSNPSSTRHSPRVICHGLLTLAFLLTLCLTAQASQEVPPTLTGRWGDTLYPSQLVYEYPAQKQTINGRTIEVPPRRSKLLVVVSMTTRCPLAQRAVSVLNQTQVKYWEQGVDVIGLFTDHDDDVRAMADFALDSNAAFPVFLDDQSIDKEAQASLSWARRELGMTTTPEAVVLDVRGGWSKRVMVYRGMIDDALSITSHRARARRHYVHEALDQALTRETSTDEHFFATAPQGCKIAKLPFERDAEAVKYYPTIAKIVQEKCERCHRPGELGGESFMAFERYEDIVAVAPTVMDRVMTRIMPPWQARVPQAAQEHVGQLVDDLTLTDNELQAFVDWYAAGMPEGNPQDAPPARDWPPTDDWKIGEPDVVLEMPEPFIVPQERWDGYRYYYLDTNFDEERFVQAIELRPGNRNVVHHMGAILGPRLDDQPQGTDAMLHFYGLTGEEIKKLGDWVPGGGKFNARVYPPGTALRIPPQHSIVLEMHYTPTGGDEPSDRSSIGLIFSDQPPQQIMESKVGNYKKLNLPPYQPHIEYSDRYWFPTDVLIHAVGPRMHYRGKDYTLYQVESPGTSDERRRKILEVSAYDFRWQRTYEFTKPLKLQAGDYLEAVAHFDNSHFNPNNPQPAAWVRFGLQSDDEMFNTRFKYTVMEEPEASQTRARAARRAAATPNQPD